MNTVKANQKWQHEDGTIVTVYSVRKITETEWTRMRIPQLRAYSGSTHFVRYIEEGTKLIERTDVEGFEERFTLIQ